MANTKYDTLICILDAIRQEATASKWEKKYAVASGELEEIRQARSRAYIHLYLKVMFGLSDFSERESFVTDGTDDGGIDGFYIDQDARKIYLIQSKFRGTEKNFEEKEISLEELVVMDVDRITSGKTAAANGNTYNGKIQSLIRRISEISDIARYNYHIVILANCTLPPDQIRKFTEGYPATVFNFERSYNELIFPIISGTYYRAHDVTIRLDLSNKSASAKTSYSVGTPEYQCEITVLFIPTIEIAKVMDKYRNTILEYNPRSYLELEGQQVNKSIRETLCRPDTNAFALMNNGITILSDETSVNERIGQENKAQLLLVRPQIINGGQTAFTLSRIYNEDKEGAEARFSGKEVLTKIITLTPRDSKKDTAKERIQLIDEISEASNRQTPVISADRMSNDPMYKDLQSILFSNYGVFLERKRGEFNDGIASGYLARAQVLERNLFLRVFLAAQGQLVVASKKRIFLQHNLAPETLMNKGCLDSFFVGYSLFLHLVPRRGLNQNFNRYRDVLAKVYLGVALTSGTEDIGNRVERIDYLWEQLVAQVAQFRSRYTQDSREAGTGAKRGFFSLDRWMKSYEFERDIHDFVESGSIRSNSTSETGGIAQNLTAPPTL